MRSLYLKVSSRVYNYSVTTTTQTSKKYSFASSPEKRSTSELKSIQEYIPSAENFGSGMVFRKVIDMMMGCLGMSNRPTLPSPSETNESPEVDLLPAIKSPRIRLSDGRYLAYREVGVPKDQSNYRIIIVHGFGSSKEMNFLAPEEMLTALGIYILLYDRAGYGESDPNPRRSVKSEATDIEELADQLELGTKFYVMGVSLGCYPVWSCLKRLPHRLAGAALIVPMINYKWRTLPKDLVKDDYRKNLSKWIIWLCRHTPGLLHWWLTQKVFPSANVLDKNPAFFNSKDLESLGNTPGYQLFTQNGFQQRQVFDSIRRDCIVAFGKWDFEPMELTNPYPENETSVHIWQGFEDKVVPVKLQRYVSERLPWIRYHEVPGGGHMLVYDSAVCEAILRSLLLGEDPPQYRPN
ncbi:OLC1v1004584C1 [Oldenlandia corymbosa var. corymbosa]|uniref:OLC1v1004584C1 n=1 Tax=Oldenlandia corymbosa var. corymbosa TaxID=529605 RepID=A0AAV1DFL7_OLDCO|nr:OLC1v1004584C1 [Oldenlandia corymbosa var. corymbosa]